MGGLTMARPPIELDDARRRRLLSALEAGATLRMAAAAAGVSESTLSRWRKAKPELDADIEQAEATGAVQALEVIRTAATSGTWQAAAWLLERRYPGEYGRRVPKVDEAPDVIRSYLDQSLERFKRLYGRAQEEGTTGLAKVMGVEAWDAGLHPAGVIVLPAEDDDGDEPPPPPRPRARRDDGLAFS